MNELTIIKQSVILFGREINYVMLCYVMHVTNTDTVTATLVPSFCHVEIFFKSLIL